MAINTLLYLHGFNSSPSSEKAQQTQRFFNGSLPESFSEPLSESDVARDLSEMLGEKQGGNAYSVIVPALPAEPAKAIAMLKNVIQTENVTGLIGSSLGGYYSMYLHAMYKLPAVLINPAVRPYELLSDYIGLNTNMYTGETYEVKAEHMEQLKALDLGSNTLELNRLFLLTESEDEVLSYQQAAEKLLGAKMYLSRGGDHSYVDFTRRLPAIAHFFNGILAKS